MQLFSVLLFAVSCNFDNLAVGFNYGAKKIHIPLPSVLLIGAVTFAGTLLSMEAGKKLIPLFPEGFARIVGSSVILLMGGYGMLCYVKKRLRSGRSREREKQNAVPPSGRELRLRESAALGTALAVNNIGLGAGASISGLGTGAACAASLGIGILFLILGNRAGSRWLSDRIGEYAEPISAAIMIRRGICESAM